MTHRSIMALVRVYFIVERQHGSEKEGASQGKQGGPQRFGAKGCAYTRQKQSGP